MEGIYFDETFAPVARLESILLLMAFACTLRFRLYQMNVKSAFLNGYLNEEVFVAQPKDFEDPTSLNYLYKLNKALYGLKQTLRAWYERLSDYLIKKGYSRGRSNRTFFIKQSNNDVIMTQIYVDDIVFDATSHWMVDHLVEHMSSEFEMSLVGELTYFLGLQVKQTSNVTFISQTKYAKNLVKKFGLELATHCRTPFGTHIKIFRDERGKNVDQTLYRSMIGSLLYLTTSLPFLCYNVGICACYQACPKESHLTTIKKIIKYVNGTTEFRLWYSRDSTTTMMGYCNVDWAGNSNDRKSTSSVFFFLETTWFHGLVENRIAYLYLHRR